MSCLYILEISPLSVALFANIISWSEGYLFILFMVSFAVQKLLSLIRPHLYIFVFISITLRGESKRILLAVMYVQEYTGCVFLKEVYSFWAYIYLSL